MGENGNGDFRVLEERINNFMQESEADRNNLRMELTQMRNQTHEWMQAMLNRLPPWAVAVGSILTTVLGAMVTMVFTRK